VSQSRRFVIQVKQAITKQTEKILDEIVEDVAKAQVQNINNRLDKGIGINDKQMPELKKRYAQRKGKGNIRNLYNKGTMRGSIKVTPGRRKAIISFRSTKEKNKARYNEQRYKWWGISKKDNRVLIQVVNRLIKRLTKG